VNEPIERMSPLSLDVRGGDECSEEMP